jgi:C-terminal processing protease CtpA/Prc
VDEAVRRMRGAAGTRVRVIVSTRGRNGQAQGIAPDVQVEQVELPEEPAAGSSATTRAPAALR